MHDQPETTPSQGPVESSSEEESAAESMEASPSIGSPLELSESPEAPLSQADAATVDLQQPQPATEPIELPAAKTHEEVAVEHPASHDTAISPILPDTVEDEVVQPVHRPESPLESAYNTLLTSRV